VRRFWATFLFSPPSIFPCALWCYGSFFFFIPNGRVLFFEFYCFFGPFTLYSLPRCSPAKVRLSFSRLLREVGFFLIPGFFPHLVWGFLFSPDGRPLCTMAPFFTPFVFPQKLTIPASVKRSAFFSLLSSPQCASFSLDAKPILTTDSPSRTNIWFAP